MLKFSLRISDRALKLLRRLIVVSALLVFFAMAGLFLVLRYSILPNIEHYRQDITAGVSRVVGLRVEIDQIEADWYGLSPHLRLSDIRILDKNARTTLELQHVDVVVSWMTLMAAELRLASLEIDQPDLMVKRDAQGRLQISGVQLGGQSSDNQSTDNNFANLLLSQPHIVVRDAHISWLDEQKAKPLLVFDRVNLIVENRWHRHRFALRATPPAELSSQLDVRGNFYGNNLDTLQDWQGEIYTQLEYADLPAWRTWLPLPEALKQGKGALRGWLGIERGKLNRVTADLALDNVQTRLAEDLPALDMRSLRGRLGWHDLGQGFEVSTRNFSLKLFDNFELKPTDVFFSLRNGSDTQSASGEMRANLLELNGLSKLLEYLPLERKLKDQLAGYAPQGSVSNLQASWQLDESKKLHYMVKARFADLALQRVGKFPGFSGISGVLDGNESKGSVSINGHNVRVDAPDIMPQALGFDSLSGQGGWQRNADGLEVNFRNVAVANPDIAGTAYGSYQTLAGSPGKVDLNLHLSRASVAHAAKYIPLLALGDGTRSWLNKALQDGQSSDVNFRLKGDLNDFPFVDNRTGIFKVQVRAKGVTLAYAPGWPRIDNGTADFLLQGKMLEVSAPAATTLGVNLKNVKVGLDIMDPDLLLAINGVAETDNAHALAYVTASPVSGYLGGFTDKIEASGNGRLNLQLGVPLTGNKSTRVTGSYHFTDSEIEFDKNLPTARKVNGDLLFSESGVSTKNVTAQILGGPATLQVETTDAAGITVKLAGRANFAALKQLNPNPLLRKLQGEPVWQVDVAVKNKLGKIRISSNLEGLQSDLPAPLVKTADEILPVHVEVNDVAANRKTILVQVGAVLNANLQLLKDEEDSWGIKRGMVNFGNVPLKADKEGLWVIGTIPRISLDGWQGLPAAPGGGGGGISLAGSDVLIQKISGYGYALNDLHIKANTRSGNLAAQLAGPDVNGDVSWQDADAEAGDYGHLQARFKNLDLLAADETVAKAEPPAAVGPQQDTGIVQLPELDLQVEKLSVKGRQVGKLDVQAQQEGNVYRLEHLRLVNADGVLAIDGNWKMSARDALAKTQMNVKMELANAGNVLARSGYPNSVKNGKGKLEGFFNWAGTPAMFGMDRLNGNFSLDTSKGQFMQIDPGIGKLLSILSLQALPKRITLDFEDVFSNGFEFDSITGSAEIKQGVLATDNLKIEGSAARVAMSGQVDLDKETQDLHVHIVPTVGNSVALISALVATPVIGAGVYLAGKILNDPLGQLASFEYNISGNWADPKVEKVSKK